MAWNTIVYDPTADWSRKKRRKQWPWIARVALWVGLHCAQIGPMRCALLGTLALWSAEQRPARPTCLANPWRRRSRLDREMEPWRGLYRADDAYSPARDRHTSVLGALTPVSGPSPWYATQAPTAGDGSPATSPHR